MLTPLTTAVTRHASDRPDAPAIRWRDRTMTYGELDTISRCVAASLARAGLHPGDRVAVYARRTPEVVAFLLGVLRAGGVYVPVDPESPPARASRIVADCGCSHLLVDAPLLRRWTDEGEPIRARRIWLTADSTNTPLPQGGISLRPWSDLVGATRAEPHGQRDPDDPAYILYTSGSTGQPKGVVLSYRNATAFVEWAIEALGATSADVFANYAPLHFDLSVLDFYGAFSVGARTVVVPDALRRVPSGLVRLVSSEDVTIWYSVPAPLVWMLRRGGLDPKVVPHLRVVVFAGEVFPPGDLRELMLALPAVRYFNFFGPTETNVCLAYEVEEPPAPDAPPVPAGWPASGARIEVRRQEDGQPAVDGEPGLLWVDGPTVMLGYWEGGGWRPAPRPYPTGDRVVRAADGLVHFLGRQDHMVKVQGYRVELGEVEQCLIRHPRIKEAVVGAVDGRLVACVATDDDISVLEVKRHCARLLPAYMVPAHVKVASALPRTSTGKIDRIRVLQGWAKRPVGHRQ